LTSIRATKKHLLSETYEKNIDRDESMDLILVYLCCMKRL